VASFVLAPCTGDSERQEEGGSELVVSHSSDSCSLLFTSLSIDRCLDKGTGKAATARTLALFPEGV